ncbi:hypothetical protein VTP01DRAFT_5006 [Rhizomucor pusillus]|uniref:uncharacterized protein n=1 Tax=Rhizomucor pusillus TaxID=4840 RepID=UPI003742D302
MFSESSQDEVIRGTNDDATVSRLSAVQLGYMQDPFVQYFVKRPVRRSPIINRGSYIRSRALDALVTQFLSMPTSCKKKQIVSLGAGYDTRYFLIKSGHHGAQLDEQIMRYFEIDFPEIVVKKAMILKRRSRIFRMEQARVEHGGAELTTSQYTLIGGDLREWAAQIAPRLHHHGFDASAPTLFLSECVMIYLDPAHSQAILDWVTSQVKNCMFVLYEQIRPRDAFGQMMIRNLQSRNIELKGLEAFPDLADQERRFMQLGWNGAKAVDINTIHDTYLEREDISRMAKLEILDELEEWKLLAGHYCIAWAYKADEESKDDFVNIKLC